MPKPDNNLDDVIAWLEGIDNTLADHEARIAALESTPPQPPPVSDRLSILDLSGDVLRDDAWLSQQPAGTVATFVKPIDNPSFGDIPLSLVIGAGPQGQNVVRQTMADPNQGHYFYLLRGVANGYGSYGNCYDAQGYFSSEGAEPYNRLSFKVRYPRGYRQQYCSRTDYNPNNGYPYHYFQHVGTYHYDPAKIGSGPVKESDNYHFYHYPFVRADLSDGEWVQVTINDNPQHQRSISQTVAPNPTQGHGSYFDILTRFYLASVPYMSQGGTSELPNGYHVDWCDFELWYEPPVMESSWVTHQPNQEVSVAAGSNARFVATVRNLTSESLPIRIGNASHWSNHMVLLTEDRVTLAPHGETTVELECQRADPGSRHPIGFWATPESDYNQTPFPTTNDSNGLVERRWDNHVGAHTSKSVGSRLWLTVT